MVFISVKTTNKNRYLTLTSNHSHIPKKTSNHNRTETRYEATIGSESYRTSLARAFQRAKLLAFFNPDMTHFITFTYKANELDYTKAMQDIKNFLRKEKRQKKTNHAVKYIYVFERQKRGAIHIHMIATPTFTTRKNRNGYLELVNWQNGFSSILTIDDFDINFRPYLYLLKYMTKAQRIGKSFIHTSRSFDKIRTVDYRDYIERLNEGNLLYTEETNFKTEHSHYRIYKHYYQTPETANNPTKETTPCQKPTTTRKPKFQSTGKTSKGKRKITKIKPTED